MKRIILLLITACFVLPSFAQKDSVAVFYSANINAKHISKYMHRLVSEEFAGRETGEEGQKLAAKYIAEEFKKSGVLPGNGDSYFQYYDLKFSQSGGIGLSINGTSYSWLEDFYTYYKISNQELKKDKVLFLGYGLENDKWNNFKDLDIKDKVVLVLEGEPKNKKGKYYLSGNDKKTNRISGNRSKVRNLKSKEPAAIIIATKKVQESIKQYEHWINRKRAELDKSKEEAEIEPPVLFVSYKVANKLLESKGSELGQLNKAIQKKGKPMAFYAKAELNINVKNKEEIVQVENVVASVLAAEKTDEWIIITAHYDHLGAKEEGIYYGADDNASGTAAVMMMAHTFAEMAKNGQAPKRNIAFMLVSGEEKGLLGSSYYVENPVIPLENTVCNLNIDMIGRVDEDHAGNENYVYLIGADRLSTELHEISANTAKTYTNLELDYTFNDPDDPNRFYSRSDHYNFAKNNIPVIFYFNGVHEDYHKVTDTIDKISFNKVEKITKLVFFTAYEIAKKEDRLKVDVAETKEEN